MSPALKSESKIHSAEPHAKNRPIGASSQKIDSITISINSIAREVARIIAHNERAIQMGKESEFGFLPYKDNEDLSLFYLEHDLHLVVATLSSEPPLFDEGQLDEILQKTDFLFTRILVHCCCYKTVLENDSPKIILIKEMVQTYYYSNHRMLVEYLDQVFLNKKSISKIPGFHLIKNRPFGYLEEDLVFNGKRFAGGFMDFFFSLGIRKCGGRENGYIWDGLKKQFEVKWKKNGSFVSYNIYPKKEGFEFTKFSKGEERFLVPYIWDGLNPSIFNGISMDVEICRKLLNGLHGAFMELERHADLQNCKGLSSYYKNVPFITPLPKEEWKDILPKQIESEVTKLLSVAIEEEFKEIKILLKAEKTKKSIENRRRLAALFKDLAYRWDSLQPEDNSEAS